MERKLKRRFERESFCDEKRARVKKVRTPKKKKLKLNHSKDLCTNKLERERERLFEMQRSSESHLLPSDMSFSEQEDSEDEDAICPAVNCLQPEGDEVSRGRPLWCSERWDLGRSAALNLLDCGNTIYKESMRHSVTQRQCLPLLGHF